MSAVTERSALERIPFDEILDRYRAIKQLTHFEDL